MADALSRKFSQETYPEIGRGIDAHVFSVVETLPVSDKKLEGIKNATENDQLFVTLTNTILNGWPEQRTHCPSIIAELRDHRDELTIINGIVFGNTPQLMFWAKMSFEIQETVGNCSVCLGRRGSECKKSLISHPIPDRPWQIVLTYLFTWNDQDFVVVVDQFSRFIEIEKLPSSPSSSVIC